MVGQRASWYQSSGFNLVVIIGALAVFVITLLLWPIGYFTRRHYGKPLNVPPTMKKSWLLSRLVCIAISFS